MFSAILFDKCEEVFDLIPDEDRTGRGQEIIDQVTEYLSDDVDGRTNRDALVVAEELEPLLQELWGLIPIEEKNSNNNLVDYFDDLMESVVGVLDAYEKPLSYRYGLQDDLETYDPDFDED